MKIIYTPAEWVKFEHYVSTEECKDLAQRTGTDVYTVAWYNPRFWGGPSFPTSIEVEPKTSGPKVSQQTFVAPASKPGKEKSITITARNFREALRLLLAAWPDGAQ